MNLSRRILALFALALAITGAGLFLALRARENLIESARQVTHTYEIIETLDGLLTDMLDVETGQRGFVITGEDRYLEPQRLAAERVAVDVEKLDAQVRDPRVRAWLEELVQHVEHKLSLSREVVGRRRSGGFEAAAATIQAMHGKETMDEIRRLVGAMRARERELLVERTTRAEEHAQFATRLFAGALLVSGALIFGVILRLRREVMARLATEGELRRHSAISDGVLTSMTDGVLVVDPAGKPILTNRAAASLLDHRTRGGDIVSSGTPAVYRADGVTPYPPDEMPLARALRGESVAPVECCTRRPDGVEPVWYEVAARPLGSGDGESLGAMAVFRDVTQARRAERALRESNDSLQASYGALERRNREVLLLGELTGLLQACIEQAEASAVIAQCLTRLLPTTSGAIYLLNPSRNLVSQGAAWGEVQPGELTFAPDDCWALRRGRAHVLDERRLGLRCRHVGAEVASCACLPLLAHGETLGVLHLRGAAAEVGAAAAEDSRHLLGAVADEVGLALANLRLRDSLRQQSIRDPLTGLFNRRYMEESFERELLRAVRHGTSIGVLVIDVDHFKDFNDTYGHDAGDALLCELGAVLKAGVRGEDIACRYGGEEFVMILPDASAAETMQRAEALRARAKGIVVHHGERTLRTVTLSIGVALFPDHAHDAKTLVQVADRALYQAKRGGRDRVVLAGAASEAGSESAA